MTSTNRGAPVSIGELSRQTGCQIETVRYYERVGVMPKPPRTEGGHRYYPADQVKRLIFVRRGRELGFTLDQIRGLLRFVDTGNFSCADVKSLTDEHLAELRKKIADLRRMERVLREMAAQCDGGSVPECPIIDALSASVSRRVDAHSAAAPLNK